MFLPQKAKIHSFQPKQTGKQRDWINVQAKNESVDWEEVKSCANIENKSVVYLNSSQNLSQEVVDAKQKEIQNMEDNDAFTEVEYKN